MCNTQGRIQDFKLGGAHIKNLRRAEGGAKNFGVYRVKKITILSQKIIFFSNFKGCARPEFAPDTHTLIINTLIV